MRPQYKLFALNVLPQNSAVEISIDVVTLREEFVVHTPVNVRKKEEQETPFSVLETASALTTKIWSLVVAIDPTPVKGDDP